MSVNPHKLELLWARLEDAKLQLDRCHNFMREIRQDKASGVVPEADGNLAHKHALRAEAAAVERYLRVLEDFKGTFEWGNAPASPEPAAEAENGRHGITPREREVLALIVAGKSSKEIAADLHIAFRTVVCHRYRLYQKLQVHTNVELTRAALRMGLVEF